MKRTGLVVALFAAVVLLALPQPKSGPPAVAFSPGPEHRIPPEQLSAWILEGDPVYLLVDVRSESAYADDAIKTASSIPFSTLDPVTVRTLPKHRRIVVYGATPEETEAAWRMLAPHHERVYVLDGALAAWQDRVLEPDAPPSDAPEARWADYRARVAAANYFLGKTGVAPVERERVVRPVLRPRAPMTAGEGC